MVLLLQSTSNNTCKDPTDVTNDCIYVQGVLVLHISMVQAI